ncbi:MAG: PTS sugar transporter subunit IIA [Planctomycetes bacterium]|nr:PTS sugar transporter subunit IIA [Planctomycetota bacterium]
MIDQGTVRARVAALSWEDAVDYVGALLVKAGKIHPSYISAMKRVLHEMGPYAVIAPGIVLLHARPEDGVLEPCLGLVTLSTPVFFGHSQNDPVDLVFALGAVDNKAHIAALKQLAEMLGNADVLSKMRAAHNDLELFEVFD